LPKCGTALQIPVWSSQFVEAVRLFRWQGISTFGFFVVGLLGDILDTILASMCFTSRRGASGTQFTVATPFIGTELHDWAADHDLVAREH
jgi:hypothetical protein